MKKSIAWPLAGVLALMPVAACAAPAAPEPPKTSFEFFGPIDREHSVTASCRSKEARVVWSFVGGAVTFREVNVAGSDLSAAHLKQIDTAVSQLDGDVFVRLQCDGEAAGITIIEDRFAGTSRASQLRFDYLHGKLELVKTLKPRTAQ